ncbi:hypothetical protein ACFYSJ_21290 [Streptomyces sp. NPDC005248]|uniref:hypothetical protein n=1 Tax=Streptomyces sp. NPDC005248 TaxID=3364709 RepID=UPI0036C96726
MSKLLPEISPELEAAFIRFLAACTVRAPIGYTVQVWAIRAAFRRYVRDNDLYGKPSDLQVHWLLDDMNLPVENIPDIRTKVVMPHVCGIRIVHEGSSK